MSLHLARPRSSSAFCFVFLAWASSTVTLTASAGGPYFRRPSTPTAPVYEPTAGRVARVSPAQNDSGGLGTFYPTPYLMVRGNAPAGGGYSPLGSFGDTTLSIYGPISSFRPITAPVWTYSRGYDGQPVIRPGTSVSTPNEPSMTNVVYPTQSTYYYGFRDSGSPPWFANGINWIDQN